MGIAHAMPYTSIRAIMNMKTGLGRPSGRGEHTRRLCQASWLAALLIAAPAMADPEADGADLLSVFWPAVSTVAASDGELLGARAKGLERMALRPDENVGVILWDESGTGDRAGSPKHDGNSLVMIRYGGQAE